MEKQTVRLDPADLAQIKTLARHDNVTVTEWCRQAVLDRLAGQSVAATVQRELAVFHRTVAAQHAAFHADMAAKEDERFMTVAKKIGTLHIDIEGHRVEHLSLSMTDGGAA
ncbi:MULTISPECIES: hypothetical protein [Paraburkholderia]|uniref:hypothetical protein n=1 Tax=Paraburkholderia TaxID=1822464 RepID=UPI001F2BDBAF|nr:hypothetical protein [Paraburkholderia tropica]